MMIDEQTETELRVGPDSEPATSDDSPTRWDRSAAPDSPARATTDASPSPERRERGGLILAAIVALLMPMIIVVAISLSSTDNGSTVDTRDDAASITPSTGLGELGINEVPDVPAEAIVAEVEGAVIEAPSTTARGVAPAITPSAADDAEADAAEADAADAEPSDAPTGRAGSGTAAASNAISRPTVPSTTIAPTRIVTATTAPAASSTTVGPTTSSPAPTVAPNTVAPSTTAPLRPTLPAGEQDADPVPEDDAASPLTGRVEIGQLGDTFVRFRFTTRNPTTYRAVILEAGRVVATRGGSSNGGEVVNESVDGLTPGRDYAVQVVLNGPPAFTAAPVSFRTAGGDPAPVTADVELLNLRVVQRDSTRIEFRYETNVCANGSFVIRRQGGSLVGSNGGQAEGCTTRHLGIPGFWTPALQPGTTYEITVTVEANGAGRGAGNTASQTIVVTTAS